YGRAVRLGRVAIVADGALAQSFRARMVAACRCAGVDDSGVAVCAAPLAPERDGDRRVVVRPGLDRRPLQCGRSCRRQWRLDSAQSRGLAAFAGYIDLGWESGRDLAVDLSALVARTYP